MAKNQIPLICHTRYAPSSLRYVLSASVACLSYMLSGCVGIGPPVLGTQVLGYDQVAKTLNEKLLLLNIARVFHYESVHFTTTSSIAATFDWTTTIGAVGQVNKSSQSNFLNFSLGGSSSENPTFSIVPVAGEDFTKRIVTPFEDRLFEFLVFQGAPIDQVMRLMAGGVEVQRLDTGGPVIGLIEDCDYQQGSVTLAAGDVLVAYTDGVSEAMNAAMDEWGEGRLMETVEPNRSASAHALIEQVMTAADAFVAGAPQHDDMTLLVVRAV